MYGSDRSHRRRRRATFTRVAPPWPGNGFVKSSVDVDARMAPLWLDARFLQPIVGGDTRLFERLRRGLAFGGDVLKRARPEITHAYALRLRHPGHPRRLEVLRDGFDV